VLVLEKVKKLKVGITARILDTKQVRGWSRYTMELIRGLVQHNVQVVLLSDKPINDTLYDSAKVSLVCQAGRSYFDWEQRVLPKIAQLQQLDILHCPINYGLPVFGKTKKILTIHDAISKSFHDPQKSFFEKCTLTDRKMRIYNWLSQKAADAVITVSEHAKLDLIKHYGIPQEKIKVIYEGADQHFSEKNVKPYDKIKKKYPSFVKDSLFYVGGFEERKNIEGLIAAYAESKKTKPLVLAGQGSQHVKGDNIFGIGYVDDEDLPSLYYYCFAFIYPSFYEGFGLQAVEAMQMKKPVLVSANTSLKEVVARDECTFDPYSTQSIVEKINWLFSKANTDELSEASFQRAKKFSWDQCITETLTLYEKVLSR
jgi:glycosyltransferase involved in cell wall biosynthesis